MFAALCFVLASLGSSLPEKCAGLDLTFLETKLTQDRVFANKAVTHEVVEAYRDFFCLMATPGTGTLAPSPAIDKVWHQHILFTMRYAKDCRNVAGQFLHHSPSITTSDRKVSGNGYANTLEAYTKFLGIEAPKKFWPRVGASCYVYPCSGPVQSRGKAAQNLQGRSIGGIQTGSCSILKAASPLKSPCEPKRITPAPVWSCRLDDAERSQLGQEHELANAQELGKIYTAQTTPIPSCTLTLDDGETADLHEWNGNTWECSLLKAAQNLQDRSIGDCSASPEYEGPGPLRVGPSGGESCSLLKDGLKNLPQSCSLLKDGPNYDAQLGHEEAVHEDALGWDGDCTLTLDDDAGSQLGHEHELANAYGSCTSNLDDAERSGHGDEEAIYGSACSYPDGEASPGQAPELEGVAGDGCSILKGQAAGDGSDPPCSILKGEAPKLDGVAGGGEGTNCSILKGRLATE